MSVKGSIPRSIFNQEIKEIHEKSKKIGDSWKLTSKTDEKDVFYLERIDQKYLNGEIYSLNLHIVYSESYTVPVLYLNLFKSNGSIAKYEEIYDYFRLNKDELKICGSDLILTQQEHPILFRPFYFLHPCKTSEWMIATNLNDQGKKLNFTLKWLSFVFSALNISFDIKYALD